MKIKNKNLTPEQKLILFEEGTERPGSSNLNSEKRKGSYHCVVMLGCLILILSLKVVQDGHPFLSHYQMFLKPKLITHRLCKNRISL